MFVPYSLYHLSNLIEMSCFAYLGIRKKVLHSYGPLMSYRVSPLIYRYRAYGVSSSFRHPSYYRVHPTSLIIHTGTQIVTRFIPL